MCGIIINIKDLLMATKILSLRHKAVVGGLVQVELSCIW